MKERLSASVISPNGEFHYTLLVHGDASHGDAPACHASAGEMGRFNPGEAPTR